MSNQVLFRVYTKEKEVESRSGVGYILYALTVEDTQSGINYRMESFEPEQIKKFWNRKTLIFDVSTEPFNFALQLKEIKTERAPGSFDATLSFRNCRFNFDNARELGELFLSTVHSSAGKYTWTDSDFKDIIHEFCAPLIKQLFASAVRDIPANSLLNTPDNALDQTRKQTILDALPKWMSCGGVYVEKTEYYEKREVEDISNDWRKKYNEDVKELEKKQEQLKLLQAQNELANAQRIVELNQEIEEQKIEIARKAAGDNYEAAIHPDKAAWKKVFSVYNGKNREALARILYWYADHPILSIFASFLFIVICGWFYSVVYDGIMPSRVEFRIENIAKEQAPLKNAIVQHIRKISDGITKKEFVFEKDDQDAVFCEVIMSPTEYRKIARSLDPEGVYTQVYDYNVKTYMMWPFDTISLLKMFLPKNTIVLEAKPAKNIIDEVKINIYGDIPAGNAVQSYLESEGYYFMEDKIRSNGETIKEITVSVLKGETKQSMRDKVESIAEQNGATVASGETIEITGGKVYLIAWEVTLSNLTLDEREEARVIFKANVASGNTITVRMRQDDFVGLVRLFEQETGLTADIDFEKKTVKFQKAFKITFVNDLPAKVKNDVDTLLKVYNATSKAGSGHTVIYTLENIAEKDKKNLLDALNETSGLRPVSEETNSVQYEYDTFYEIVIPEKLTLTSAELAIVMKVFGASRANKKLETKLPEAKITEECMQSESLKKAALTSEWIDNTIVIHRFIEVRFDQSAGPLSREISDFLKQNKCKNTDGSTYLFHYDADDERLDFINSLNNERGLERVDDLLYRTRGVTGIAIPTVNTPSSGQTANPSTAGTRPVRITVQPDRNDGAAAADTKTTDRPTPPAGQPETQSEWYAYLKKWLEINERGTYLSADEIANRIQAVAPQMEKNGLKANYANGILTVSQIENKLMLAFDAPLSSGITALLKNNKCNMASGSDEPVYEFIYAKQNEKTKLITGLDERPDLILLDQDDDTISFKVLKHVKWDIVGVPGIPLSDSVKRYIENTTGSTAMEGYYEAAIMDQIEKEVRKNNCKWEPAPGNDIVTITITPPVNEFQFELIVPNSQVSDVVSTLNSGKAKMFTLKNPPKEEKVGGQKSVILTVYSYYDKGSVEDSIKDLVSPVSEKLDIFTISENGSR